VKLGTSSDENEFRLRSLMIADASETKLDIESGVRGGDPARLPCATVTAA